MCSCRFLPRSLWLVGLKHSTSIKLCYSCLKQSLFCTTFFDPPPSALSHFSCSLFCSVFVPLVHEKNKAKNKNKKSEKREKKKLKPFRVLKLASLFLLTMCNEIDLAVWWRCLKRVPLSFRMPCLFITQKHHSPSLRWWFPDDAFRFPPISKTKAFVCLRVISSNSNSNHRPAEVKRERFSTIWASGIFIPLLLCL